MERYTLEFLYDTADDFKSALNAQVTNSGLLMGTTINSDVVSFVASAVYGYFYEDLIAYEGEDAKEVSDIFIKRLGYDVSVRYLYWARKYAYIKKLLTDEDLSLLQTSKMTSSSSDTTKSAGGSLQKVATTPTGVSVGASSDDINIAIGKGTTDGDNDIVTDGFVDKYTNSQQKYANANRIEGEREGNILREGSINELVDVLEKLPSSFADEITKQVQKHFIFDYDGLLKEYY